MIRPIVTAIIFLEFLAVFGVPAHAGILPLPPGGLAPFEPTSLFFEPSLAGPTIASRSDVLDVPLLSVSVTLHTTIESFIVRTSKDTLDFYYRFTNENIDDIGIGTPIFGGFDGLQTSIAYRSDLGGKYTYTDVERTLDGDVITFVYYGAVLRLGESSVWFLMRTDAMEFTTGASVSVLVGQQFNDDRPAAFGRNTLNSYGPVPIPEPSSLYSLLLFSFAGIRFRRVHR